MQLKRVVAGALAAQLLVAPMAMAAENKPEEGTRRGGYKLLVALDECTAAAPAIKEPELEAFRCVDGATRKGQRALEAETKRMANYSRGYTGATSFGLLGLLLGGTKAGNTTLTAWAATAVIPGMWNDLASPKNAKLVLQASGEALGLLYRRYGAIWHNADDYRAAMKSPRLRPEVEIGKTCESLQGVARQLDKIPASTERKIIAGRIKALQETCKGIGDSRLSLTAFEETLARRGRWLSSYYTDDARTIWTLTDDLISGNWPEPSDASGVIVQSTVDSFVTGGGGYTSKSLILKTAQFQVPLHRLAIAAPGGALPTGAIQLGGDVTDCLAALEGKASTKKAAESIRTDLTTIIDRLNEDVVQILAVRAAAADYVKAEQDSMIAMSFQAPRGSARFQAATPAPAPAPAAAATTTAAATAPGAGTTAAGGAN